MGYTTHTCNVCGNSYQDSFVDATGHDCEATVVAPTCTGYGYTEHACKHCDYHYTSDMQQPLGHVGQLQCALKATCTSDGWHRGYPSARSAAKPSRLVKSFPPPATALAMSGPVTQRPDCFHDGHRTHTCTTCEETETEILEKKSSSSARPKPSPTWIATVVPLRRRLCSDQRPHGGHGQRNLLPDSHMTRDSW